MIHETQFDSLRIYERLKNAKMNDEAAKEITSFFSDIVETQIATKRDIKELEREIKRNLIESDLKAKNIESNLEFRIKETASNLEVRVKETESKLESQLKNTEFKLEIRTQETKIDLLKWVVVGMLIAQTGILVSAIKFLR